MDQDHSISGNGLTCNKGLGDGLWITGLLFDEYRLDRITGIEK